MDTNTLLEHREFVLHVARALLRDEADAEDAVQDTYVAAMQSAPPRKGNVRPWLGGIVRNIARNRHRSERRRLSRETRAARPDRVSGAAESSERLAWQQRVVEAVLALEPKYRDVLVLRFYEDLPPREVAAQLGIPVNTVRTRTRRAIEQMRGSFDKKYGGRKAWSAAIAGLFFIPAAASAGISKLAVAAVLVVVTGATGLLIHTTTRDAKPPNVRTAQHGGDRERADPSRPGAEDATAKVEQAAAPMFFRGRFFDAKTKAPLAGAEVILGTTSMGWSHGSPMKVLRTGVTDEEGRFQLRWKPGWKFVGREVSAFLLYARKEGRWSDPIYATSEGVSAPDGVRLAVELLDNPRFEFVLGDARTPVVGARFSILRPAESTSIELGALVSKSVTDAQGMVRCEWPSWLPIAILRLERANGDVVQWQLPLQQVRSYDPYDVLLDEGEVATVQVHVRNEDGSPAGAGVRVHATGSWAPDGVLETEYLGRRAPGAESVPLIGTTDKQGVATFRFPADRARHGFYLPERMVAFRMRGSRPQCVIWQYDGSASIEDQVARTGRALPTLRFGPAPGRRPMLFVRGVENYEDIEFHGRVGNGRVRLLPLDTERVIEVSDVTLYTLHDGAPAHLDREDVTIVTGQYDTRPGFRTYTSDEFARCLRGETVLEPGAPRKTREITIRIPIAREVHEVALEAVEQPFVIGDCFNSNGSVVIDLPDIPGKWRVLLDGERSVGKPIDPQERTEFTLDVK